MVCRFSGVMHYTVYIMPIFICLTGCVWTVDVSDAPPELGMARVAYFWNKFCLKEGDTPVKLALPWKKGEEPRWYMDLALPPETIVSPSQQLDPREIGPRRWKKSIRRLGIKQFNQGMVAKQFSQIKKNQKQLPP